MRPGGERCQVDYIILGEAIDPFSLPDKSEVVGVSHVATQCPTSEALHHSSRLLESWLSLQNSFPSQYLTTFHCYGYYRSLVYARPYGEPTSRPAPSTPTFYHIQ